MSSIFRKSDEVTVKPKRNTFDLSFQNNLTLKFGVGVPVLVQECLPGDSFKIDPTFALRYLPQKFPVQTRQRASLKYYYVRNRNLWKDWIDFIGKTKSDLASPYFNFQYEHMRIQLQPSSLFDYMGVPCKVGQVKNDLRIAFPWISGTGDYVYVPQSNQLLTDIKGESPVVQYTSILPRVNMNVPRSRVQNQWLYVDDWYGGLSNDIIPSSKYDSLDSEAQASVRTQYSVIDVYNESIYLKWFREPIRFSSLSLMSNVFDGARGVYLIARTNTGRDVMYVFDDDAELFTLLFTDSDKSILSLKTDGSAEMITETITHILGFMCIVGTENQQSWPSNLELRANTLYNPNLYWCDVDSRDIPYYGSGSKGNNDGIKINVLPFRGYEAIYNALVRNAENNPFILNGNPEYNKFIMNDSGGEIHDFAITNLYHCNWSDDRFTTALPSPQQGNAPLVGLTGVQGATLVTSTDDGTTSTLHLQVDSVTGSVKLVDGVSSDSPEYLNDAMMSAVEYGITINDLRNVNAFQKWLENNIRKGYKYKDQLKSHYGVTARFDVLDMPEFIGGVTRDVDVNQVTQTVQTSDNGNLGDYAGQSGVFGSGHAIEHYCDEHGYIIGILELKPMPLYQGAIPKHLLKSSAFDYYFPEFGKIGMQPITKKEISFSQAMSEGVGDDVFGYQRAWYDYLENLDEVHGLFESDFRNFILARDFGTTPELSKDFLTVDNDDINNTFYSDDNKDKVLGQVYQKIIAKRPIPLYGIPSIE